MPRSTIPEITSETLANMNNRYIPVMRLNPRTECIFINGVPCGSIQTDDESDPTPKHEYIEIERSSLHNAYLMKKTPKKGADILHLESVKVVTTYHNWGYYGFFKPSICEVMACSQNENIPQDAIYYWLQYLDNDTSKGPILFEPDDKNISGYHRAFVHFMRKIN